MTRILNLSLKLLKFGKRAGRNTESPLLRIGNARWDSMSTGEKSISSPQTPNRVRLIALLILTLGTNFTRLTAQTSEAR